MPHKHALKVHTRYMGHPLQGGGAYKIGICKCGKKECVCCVNCHDKGLDKCDDHGRSRA